MKTIKLLISLFLVLEFSSCATTGAAISDTGATQIVVYRDNRSFGQVLLEGLAEGFGGGVGWGLGTAISRSW
jgi:hypothetical protein